MLWRDAERNGLPSFMYHHQFDAVVYGRLEFRERKHRQAQVPCIVFPKEFPRIARSWGS
jgi:hypothetical protein